MNIAELMVTAMHLEPLPPDKYTLEDLPPGTYCAITGAAITQGYRAQSVVTSATGEFLDLLGGDITGYMSEDAARSFKGSWNMGAWLLFADGTGYHPFVARDRRDSNTYQRRFCLREKATAKNSYRSSGK